MKLKYDYVHRNGVSKKTFRTIFTEHNKQIDKHFIFHVINTFRRLTVFQMKYVDVNYSKFFSAHFKYIRKYFIALNPLLGDRNSLFNRNFQRDKFNNNLYFIF